MLVSHCGQIFRKTNQGQCEAREAKNNRWCALAGFGGQEEEGEMRLPKRRAYYF